MDVTHKNSYLALKGCDRQVQTIMYKSIQKQTINNYFILWHVKLKGDTTVGIQKV